MILNEEWADFYPYLSGWYERSRPTTATAMH